jgi:hypothetical protein
MDKTTFTYVAIVVEIMDCSPYSKLIFYFSKCQSNRYKVCYFMGG